MQTSKHCQKSKEYYSNSQKKCFDGRKFVIVVTDVSNHGNNSNSKEIYTVLLYTAKRNNQKNTVLLSILD